MTSGSKKIGEIQGLRALAAILVLLFHAKFISGGFIGVDIFYVISGYLITGLLLEELKAHGGISLKNFYLRRAKRLLPASFLVLFVTAAFAWVILPSISRGSIGRDLVATTLYISNYLFAWWQNDYQNLAATPSPFIHYWSLAVEEQFYLFWPIFLIALSKFKSGRKFLIGFSLVSVLSFLLGFWLTNVAPIWAFYSLPTRAWELSIGALIALLPALQIKSRALATIGISALLLATFWFTSQTAFPAAYALIPVLGTALLISSIGAWPRLLSKLATSPLSLWLGKISYPLYLWHWPVLVLPVALLARDLSVSERVVALLATVLLADLTNRFIEEPLRFKVVASKRILQSISIAMVFSVLIGLGLSATTTSALTVSGSRIELTKVTDSPAIYRNGCHLNFRQVSSPLCEFGKIGSGKVVILYGDSHAAQWFPALAKLASEKQFKLISLTKSSCPSIAVTRPSSGAFLMSTCTSWRKNAIARITSVKPDLVIVASFEHYQDSASRKDIIKSWRNGSLITFKLLQPLTKKIIYLVDTPLPNRNIPECLSSTNSRLCTASATNGLPQIASFQLIDPRPWLCTKTCPAIVRGNVAYRDASHISVATSVELADRLWQALIDRGFAL